MTKASKGCNKCKSDLLLAQGQNPEDLDIAKKTITDLLRIGNDEGLHFLLDLTSCFSANDMREANFETYEFLMDSKLRKEYGIQDLLSERQDDINFYSIELYFLSRNARIKSSMVKELKPE